MFSGYQQLQGLLEIEGEFVRPVAGCTGGRPENKYKNNKFICLKC